MEMKIPPSLKHEHGEMRASLEIAAKAAGKSGEAAREVARLLLPHFKKEEEYALPPLDVLTVLGGRLFLSTLNRTPAAFALAIVGAEYIARLLPKGTHQYRDFITPSQLAGWLRAAGLRLEDVSGLMYEPWRNTARVISRTDVNYLACAVKPENTNGG